MLADLQDEVSRRVVEAEAEELREPLWERQVKQGLEVLGKTEEEVLSAVREVRGRWRWLLI